MTTIRDIIKEGYREGGLIQIGTEPTASQLSEGLNSLQGVVKSLFGNELGDPLYDVLYGTSGINRSEALHRDYSSEIRATYAPLNIRLVSRLTAPTTVYLSPQPRDGSRFAVIDSAGNFSSNSLTLDGNGRKIEDSSSVTLSTDGDRKEWFYRADLGQWVLVSDLTVDGDSPFPREFDTYLSIKLALRINPRYLAQADNYTLMEFNRLQAQFRSRYTQSVETPPEAALSSINPYRRVYDFSNSESRFNFGYII